MGKISKNELSESLKLEIENAGAEIVNDFSGGVDKAASAELAKTLNTNQQTTNTQLAQKANPNLLINGDFQVWQRGTSFALPPVTSGTYTADRWAIYSSKAGGVTVNRIADNATGLTSPVSGLRLQVPSGNGICFLMHKMEVPQILRGKTVTISCLIESSNFSPVQDHAIMVCNGNNLSNLIAASPVEFSSNFPTKSTLTFRVPDVVTDNVLTILIGRSENSSDLDRTVYWVKLELGSVATPFSPKLYAEELASCQRYYLSRIVGRAVQVNPDAIYTFCPTPSTMRVSPSFALTQHTTPPGFLQPGFSSSIFTITPSGLIISSVKTAHGLSDLVVNLHGIDAEIY